MSLAETAADAASADLPPDAETLGEGPVLTLMQHIEARKSALGLAGSAALYETWLRRSGTKAEAYIAHYNLAVLRQEAGQAAAAEQHYLQALQGRELPEARYNLGLLLEQGGREQQALAQWRRLLAQQPAASSALRLLALNGLIRVCRRLGLTAALRRHLSQALEIQPGQPALAEELAGLNALAEPAASQVAGEAAQPLLQPPAAATDQVIYVVAVCFNEAAILPFFLDHYINFVGATKIVLHDGGSTDGTAEIAARYPQVELVVTRSEKLDDRALMHTRNEEWKKYRELCDWMIVCDVDEFLYHPQIRSKLVEFKQQGITLPMVEGFEMLSKTQPQFEPGHFLWQDIQAGDPNPRYYNKNLIFDPAIEINYTLGCHGCQPSGPVRRSEGFVFKNLHYRNLSHAHVVEKSRRSAARLSDWNKQTNAGSHYRINAEMSRADYNRMFLKAFNVLNPRQRPPLRREAFEHLQEALLMRDREPLIVELGVATGFAQGGDSGSTEFFAWFVHSFCGRLLSVETQERRVRHARRELATRGLLGPRVAFAAELERGGPAIDLLFIGSADYLGDENDLLDCARADLHRFTAIEPRLAADALIVLDGVLDEEDFEGQHGLLAAYLRGRGYAVRQAGLATVFAKP